MPRGLHPCIDGEAALTGSSPDSGHAGPAESQTPVCGRTVAEPTMKCLYHWLCLFTPTTQIGGADLQLDRVHRPSYWRFAQIFFPPLRHNRSLFIICSLVRSFVFSFFHSFFVSLFICLFVCFFLSFFIYLFIYLLLSLFIIYSLVRSFVRLFLVSLFVCLFLSSYYAPPLGLGTLSDDARLTSVYLSRTSGLSREQRRL